MAYWPAGRPPMDGRLESEMSISPQAPDSTVSGRTSSCQDCPVTLARMFCRDGPVSAYMRWLATPLLPCALRYKAPGVLLGSFGLTGSVTSLARDVAMSPLTCDRQV